MWSTFDFKNDSNHSDQLFDKSNFSELQGLYFTF